MERLITFSKQKTGTVTFEDKQRFDASEHYTEIEIIETGGGQLHGTQRRRDTPSYGNDSITCLTGST